MIRESAFGQVVRFVTKNKYLKYEEELEGFEIPWETTKPTDEKVGAIVPDEAREPAAPSPVHSRSPSTSSHDSIEHSKETRPSGAPTPGTPRSPPQDLSAPLTQQDGDEEQQLETTESRVIVPQRTADGVILVDWYTTDDPANPQNWSTRKKVYVSAVVAIYTFVVYASSAIYTSAQGQVIERFGLSFAEASTILSLYVAGYGLGPMLFSPLSEVAQFGRNGPYVVSFALFVILAIPTALVDNYPGLLVLRFLTGFMGSPCLATGGASMGDMYSLMKLPYGLTAWVAAAFAAPSMGPLLSGFAVPKLGWHWPFWEILIMSGPVWVLWFFTMPETSADNILLRRAHRLRKLTGSPKYMSQSEINEANKKFSRTVYDALLVPMVITIKDPAVLFTNLFTSFIYGIYYGFFEAFPLTYIGIYGFNLGELGVVYVCCFGLGCLFGIVTYVAYQWYYLEPDLRKRGMREQEHRLVPALFYVWLLPISLFWFGWTANRDVHWVVSILGIVFFAYGAFVLMQCVFMYLPLTYPRYAASLFAANDIFRSAFAAGSIIYAHPMYVNLGIGKGCSILGGLCVGGCLGIWALYYFGKGLRARSKFTGF